MPGRTPSLENPTSCLLCPTPSLWALMGKKNPTLQTHIVKSLRTPGLQPGPQWLPDNPVVWVALLSLSTEIISNSSTLFLTYSPSLLTLYWRLHLKENRSHHLGAPSTFCYLMHKFPSVSTFSSFFPPLPKWERCTASYLNLFSLPVI